MKHLIEIMCEIVMHLCQILAVIVITIGIVKSLFIFAKDSLFWIHRTKAIQESRYELGHSLSLGLGFLIAASILKTTVAPSWTDIGQLASIIAIRTLLNYFLLVEVEKYAEKKEQKPCKGNDRTAPGGGEV